MRERLQNIWVNTAGLEQCHHGEFFERKLYKKYSSVFIYRTFQQHLCNQLCRRKKAVHYGDTAVKFRKSQFSQLS